MRDIIVPEEYPNNVNIAANGTDTFSKTSEKKTKKVNKRYQELLENSLLVFDKPKKLQKFSKKQIVHLN